MFNTEQEQWLGDLIATRDRRSLNIVEGPLNDRLQTIGARLVAAIPMAHVKFTFHLVDSGEWNAFTEIGGQVYVMRKLITTAQNEDEVAAVLGHELSHNLLHHTSATYTRYFKVILQVDRVGDQKDIEEKFHRLQDTFNRRAGKLSRKDFEEREEEQQLSDLLGIYIVSRAGYDPAAFASFWDRVLELKGNTGSRLSDFFGHTDPEEKRLRGMKKLTQLLPDSCRTVRHAETSGFAEWQKAVLQSRPRFIASEAVADLSVLQLKTPLQTDAEQLRYSPDGHYILVQDEFGIRVLDRDPLQLRFRIDAENVNPARFSPDSKSIVFTDDQMKVEKWDIASQNPIFVKDLWGGVPCARAIVSPDGAFVACLRWDLNIRIVSTDSGKAVYEEKFDGRNLSYWDYLAAGRDLHKLSMLRFSADGRYLLFSLGSGTGAIELPAGRKIKLPFDVNKVMGWAFDFQGSDRVMGINWDNPADSQVVEFPSGNVLYKMKLDYQGISAPTRGDWALLRPIRDYPVGLFDLKQNKIVLGSKSEAMDLYDDELVSERKTGELARYKFEAHIPRLVEAATIPPGDISRARAFAISPNADYLAMSNAARGAVWDLRSGEQLLGMHAFESAYFLGDDLVTVMNVDVDDLKDTPAEKDKKKMSIEENQRTRSKRYFLRLNVPARSAIANRPLEERTTLLAGEFLFVLKPHDRKTFFTGRDTELRVEKIDAPQTAWTRSFPKETPFMQSNPAEDTVVLQWPLRSDGAQHEIDGNPALRELARTAKDKDSTHLIEVLQLSTGKFLGALLLDTGKGSFRLRDISASPEFVAAGLSDNRVTLYSLKTGEVLHRFFGDSPVLYQRARVITIRGDKNKLLVYDLDSMAQRMERSFAHRLVSVSLDPSRKELLVFTGDQALHRIALPTVAAQVH